MNKWLEKYSNGDIVQQNYNDVSVSLPEGFVGMGYNTKGRNYSPAWGGQFEEGGSLPKAQKGKIVEISDPKKFAYRDKMYNDSLNLYNKGESFFNHYNSRNQTYTIDQIGKFLDKQKFADDNGATIRWFDNKGEQQWDNQNEYNKIKKLLKNQPIKFTSDGSYMDFSPRYKKPTEKVVLQKEQEYPLVNKNIYKPKLKPGRITVPQMVTDEVNLPITQPRFPKGDYDYIFGPANSVIGRNYNGQFYSEDMPNQRGGVNQPDLDLLNNQEALKKYVQNKGLKFAMGGSLPGAVGFTYARTNDPAPSNGKYAKKTMPSAQDGWVTKAANAEFSCAANPRSNLNQSYSEYCNPKKGLDKDEYKALKKELSSGSMKDLLNVEEYYVLKNLADNQNRKMGREDNAYSKYFDQSTGLPISNLTNELKEEGNLRATNRMYPGRKNLLVNDVYQGILKDYNITTPQTPAQTKALLEKAYNIGYAIPKQQDGGMTYYQNGLDWKPKSMEEGGWLNQYEVPKNQNAEYKLPSITKPREASESTANTFYNPITKKIVNTATTGQTKESLDASTRAMGKTRKRDIEEEKQRVAERKSAVATKDKGKPFTLPTGETKAYKDMDWREKAYVSGKALENRGRFFENEESIIDDINPISWITDIAGGLGKAPLEARDYDSNLPYVAAILDPLIQGRMGFNPLGSAINTGKKIGSKVAQSIESGALSKAYKYNPFAFKANPEAYYRGIGKQGAEDALKTGVFRQAGVESGTPNFQKVWYATGDKGFERASAFSDGYVAQVPKTSFSDLDFLKNSMGVETRATSKHIPINEGNILKRDWLKGYKEVPRKEAGAVIKDDMGYWNPENHGKVVEIDSPYITMEGVDQPLIGISDEGDQKYMLPGKNYKFK